MIRVEEREAIVALVLAEVAARAEALVAAGCSIADVAAGMREAAEVLVSERVEAAVRNWQPDSALNAYVEHAGDTVEARRARDDYHSAASVAAREDAHARLIDAANQGALRRHRQGVTRILDAWHVVQDATPRHRARQSRSRPQSPPASASDEPPHARFSHAGAA